MKKITSDYLTSLKGFSCTGKPDNTLVRKAEEELEVSFSEDYKALISQYGAISYYGHNLSGISPYPGNDVVALTKEHRTYNTEVPLSFYVIEEVHIDGIVIWQDPSGQIYWTQPNAQPKMIFGCLYDYIANN